MKAVRVSVTQRGQVTLPAELRQRWGLRPRDKVIFEIDDGEVRLKPPAQTLRSLYGSVKPLKAKDLEQVATRAKADKARRTVEEMRKN